MDTLIHADIFFFITSIFVVFLLIGFGITLVYIIPILRNIRHLSELARKKGDKLSEDLEGLRGTVKERGSGLMEDIDGLRGAIKEEGIKVKSILDYFLAFFAQKKKATRKKVNK